MQEVRAIRPDREVLTRQRLPYFVGISGQTVGASGLSMHLVTIPPGARSEPHCHVGYETGIYVLEGRVLTRWGARLENEVISEAGEFLFVPAGGVAAGVMKPNQEAIAMPCTPCSAKVGTSGSSGMRWSLTAARARTDPARICGRIEGKLSKNTSTRPATRSVIAGPDPR